MTVDAGEPRFRNKKILMVVNDMDWFWYHRLPLAKSILAHGADLHLATNGASSDQKIKSMGITGHELPPHVSGVNPSAQISLIMALVNLLKSVRPDIAHVITLRFSLMMGLAALIAAPRMKMIFTMAGLGILFSSTSLKMRVLRVALIPLLRFSFNRENVFVIFENPDDHNLMLRHTIVSPDRSEVILGSGVDVGQYPMMPEDTDKTPMVLFCSRLLKDKGIAEFVEAARLLRNRGTAAHFVVAGKTYASNPNSVTDGQMKAWVQEGAIEWLGLRSDMPALFASCNLFVLPSYYGEGVPRVLLEAASTGRAIVTTDMPGCRETVQQGINGILIPPRDANALADAIEKLIRDPSLRLSMGAKGRALMESRFTVEKVNARTLSIYSHLLSGS